VKRAPVPAVRKGVMSAGDAFRFTASAPNVQIFSH